jgi:hypothetical protein
MISTLRPTDHSLVKSRVMSKEAIQHHPSMRAGLIRTSSSRLQAQCPKAAGLTTPVASLRAFTIAPPLASDEAVVGKDAQNNGLKFGQGGGAMSRRLAEMTESSVDTGGSSTAKNVRDAGFSEELKRQLEARIADTAFRSQNRMAIAEAELPV